MIYANNFNERLNYSTTISKKNEDGEYENMFIPVKFKGGAGVPNKTKINIQDGFMSFYKNNTGLEKVQIIVMNYDVKLPAEEFTNQFGGLVTDKDLPF
jgi:hypothetical protein